MAFDIILSFIEGCVSTRVSTVDVPEPTLVLPGLYVADYAHASERKIVKELGITHLINCADPGLAVTNPSQGDTISYECLNAKDEEGYPILQLLPNIAPSISATREGGGAVMLYCFAGMNRSVVLALGYAAYSISTEEFKDLFRRVLLKRPDMLTNTSFRHQLARHVALCEASALQVALRVREGMGSRNKHSSYTSNDDDFV
jgi:hypothetical protein